MKLRSLLADRVGQAYGLGEVITILVLVAVGAVVVYQITGALPVTAGSYADNAINAVESTGSIVFQLATIFAIVIIAALIIGVILSAFGGGKRGETVVLPPA